MACLLRLRSHFWGPPAGFGKAPAGVIVAADQVGALVEVVCGRGGDLVDVPCRHGIRPPWALIPMNANGRRPITPGADSTVTTSTSRLVLVDADHVQTGKPDKDVATLAVAAVDATAGSRMGHR